MGTDGVEAMSLGTTLLIFASVLFITIAGIFIGKNWMSSYADEMDAKDNAYVTMSFQDFIGEGKNIPVAGAYAFLSYNDRFVHTITCTYGLDRCNKATAPVSGSETDKRATDVYTSCLRTHMTGICNMRATYNQGEGGYDVIVSPAKDQLVN